MGSPFLFFQTSQPLLGLPNGIQPAVEGELQATLSINMLFSI